MFSLATCKGYLQKGESFNGATFQTTNDIFLSNTIYIDEILILIITCILYDKDLYVERSKSKKGTYALYSRFH